MNLLRHTYQKVVLLLLLVVGASGPVCAQDTLVIDSTLPDMIVADSADVLVVDSVKLAKMMKYEKKASFKPDPIRAMWLGLVFPGGGQIYNRKYWKLPIVYGGFLGCMYALNWNNQMLKDYTQAFLDIMDDDPGTKSYEKMLPRGYDISGRESQFQNIFKNKKNYYRKYRDMSIFAFAGVYLISVVDAYVDAELSSFDISKDLSLQVYPTVISTHDWLSQGKGTQSFGVQWQLTY